MLVHCHTSPQRTSGVIAMWDVLVRGRSGVEAYTTMLASNHDPADNPALVPFLNKWMPRIADELRNRGVIDTIPDPLATIGPAR